MQLRDIVVWGRPSWGAVDPKYGQRFALSVGRNRDVPLRVAVNEGCCANDGRAGYWKSPQHVFSTYGHAREDKTLTDMISDTDLTQPIEQDK